MCACLCQCFVRAPTLEVTSYPLDYLTSLGLSDVCMRAALFLAGYSVFWYFWFSLVLVLSPGTGLLGLTQGLILMERESPADTVLVWC